MNKKIVIPLIGVSLTFLIFLFGNNIIGRISNKPNNLLENRQEFQKTQLNQGFKELNDTDLRWFTKSGHFFKIVHFSWFFEIVSHL